MCFAHLRATTACTFSRSQLQKVVRTPGVFCTFWLRYVLRATTACTFSTSQLPKVVREWCVLYMLTSKCASRHKGGVQFFISHLARWLRTRRFSEPTFRLSAPIGKTRCFATFLPFRATLSLLWSSLFCSALSLFPSLLFICPHCRKFDFQTSFDGLHEGTTILNLDFWQRGYVVSMSSTRCAKSHLAQLQLDFWGSIGN